MIQNKITISCGNSKMGKIPSVSLPSGLTCNNKAPCYKLCYAHKIERIRKVVKDSYQRNFDVWDNNPDEYWRQVEGAMMMTTFFRFHVSGDIPNVDKGGEIPNNLHIIYSEWPGFYVDNKYEFPEAHIRFKDGSSTVDESRYIYHCSGNCMECVVTGIGCWNLTKGQQVLIDQH